MVTNIFFCFRRNYLYLLKDHTLEIETEVYVCVKEHVAKRVSGSKELVPILQVTTKLEV